MSDSCDNDLFAIFSLIVFTTIYQLFLMIDNGGHPGDERAEKYISNNITWRKCIIFSYALYSVNKLFGGI